MFIKSWRLLGEEMNRCDICFCLSEDSDKYMYKWPDAGRHGEDVDGFCCEECANLPPEEQYRLMKDTLSAKRARDDGMRDHETS